tara:strand:+ start:78 stop:1013 length:936 start_codon:yes stop_codon:yes gene_type:complete
MHSAFFLVLFQDVYLAYPHFCSYDRYMEKTCEITCPECNAKYRVSVASIGEGKKVKCTKCGNTWFQAPEVEDGLDVDGVEEETSPLREEADDEVGEYRFRDMLQDEADDKVGVSGAKPLPLYSLVAAIGVLLLVLVLLFGFRGALTNVIPGMEVFYTSIGFEKETKAQSLLFDRVDVVKEEGSVYKILGNIINLQNKKQRIPMIEVLPLNEQGVIVADPVTYKFAEEMMDKEESRYFEFSYVEAEPFSDIELKFVVSSETVPMMIDEDAEVVTSSTDEHADSVQGHAQEEHSEEAHEDHGANQEEEHHGHH